MWYNENGYGSMMSLGFGSGLFGFIMMILFFILIVWLVIEFTGRSSRSGNDHRSSRERSALDIARERYAKGEIDSAEYNEIKNELKK